MVSKLLCPACHEMAEFSFSKKISKYRCSECDETFDALPKSPVDPQTIFLSYAHKSEKEQDYDISEDLVLLVKAALEQDGHAVWIDKDGIKGGHNWRENITRAILGHNHFLSFLSKRSVRDPGVCLNEIAIALDKGVHFQTVLTEPEEIVKPPITVTDTQWHQFVGWQEAHSQGEATWDSWFSERMNGIRAQIEDVKNARTPGELTILRRALEPKTFHADIAKKTEDFFGRKWLFEAFDQWLDETKDQIFWLKGSPGIGKSAFAAKLVHQSNSRIIGFFKCDFQSLKSPEESAKEVICTLAYQLATRMPDYRAKLLYGQGVNDPEVILKKTADDLFRFLITEPINKQGKIVEGQRSAIVIDALDEAGRNDGTNPLLTLIKKHAPNLPDWLGIVITSRPEGYIVQELADIKAQSVSGDTAQNTQDLKDYLDKQLDSIITGDERARIIDQIIAKSDGAFLYISQIIKDKYDLTKPELLPDGMNGYFMENFSRYFKDAKKYGKETEPFLELMVAAPGPLPKAMGQELLGWADREVTMQVTEPMGSLLQEKEGSLIFFHKSLADWLQDPKRSGRYQVNSGGAKKLGEFLWREFDKGHSNEEKECKEGKGRQESKENLYKSENIWGKLIIEWLPELAQFTSRWQFTDPLDELAKFLTKNIKFSNALPIRMQLLRLNENRYGIENVQIAPALNDIGNLCFSLGDFDGAESFFRRSLCIAERDSGPNNAILITSINHLVSLLLSDGPINRVEKWEREGETRDLSKKSYLLAEQCFDVSIEEKIKSFLNYTEQLPNIDMGEYVLMDELDERGDEIVELSDDYYRAIESAKKQAESLYRRAIRLSSENQEINCSRLRIEVMGSFANFLLKSGRHQEAESVYRETLKLAEQISGPFGLDTAISLRIFADFLYIDKKYKEAESLCRRSLEIHQMHLGENHRLTFFDMHSLADILYDLDQHVESEILYKKVLELMKLYYGDDFYRVSRVEFQLANLSEIMGRYRDAESYYFSIKKRGERDRSHVWPIDKKLMRLYEKWGKPEEASRYIN
jgi:tetratricopeptide (TPR) repeat protein